MKPNVSEETIQKEKAAIASSIRPPKYEIERSLPFWHLKDSEFELLLYFLVKEKFFKTKYNINFDSAGLLAGTGDKGRDVILLRDSITVGIIQCKKYKSSISKPELVREILKFTLHKIQEGIDPSNIEYFIAATSNFTSDAMEMLKTFNSTIWKESSLENWVEEVIKENKKLGLCYSCIKDRLHEILKTIKIQEILTFDLTLLVTQAPEILNLFFKLEKVIDQKAFEDIILGKNLDVNSFKMAYKEVVLNSLSRINFLGLALSQRPREVELEALFVKPYLGIKGESFQGSRVSFDNSNSFESLTYIDLMTVKSLANFSLEFAEIGYSSILKDLQRSKKISFQSIFNRSRNLVILGRPGAGKSSLIKFSICRLLENNLSSFENQEIFDRIPFRIELSKYFCEKAKRPLGIVDYLLMLIESEYQINFIGKKALEYLFEEFDTLIFFDGLDEVVDAHSRIEIRNDIENFCKARPKVRAIVTSRFEAYEEVFFKEKDFEVLEILDFNDSQVAEYVSKWYLCEEADLKRQQSEIAKCLNDLGKIEDEIKRNPLFLSLILILFRNELELPTSKLDLYESCTKTIVETRDQKEKRLEFNLRISNKIACFASLAHWHFLQSDLKSRPPITYPEALNHLKSYLLCKNEFEEESEARTAAEEFLEFARNRSIYVDNCFSHKTFLEYFTAYYIFSNLHIKGKFQERDAFISDHIGNSSWIVVLELLICKIDQDQPDYEIIDKMIDFLEQRNAFACRVFFTHVLKYLRNVSPEKIFKVLFDSIETCISEIGEKRKDNILSLNSKINGMYQIPRFQKIISKILDDLYDKFVLIPKLSKKLAIYVLENSFDCIVSKKSKETGEFRDFLLTDPYLYILLNLNETLKDQDYYKRLQMFRNLFGKGQTEASHRSQLGESIFGGSNRFNWITGKLFGCTDLKTFQECYSILVDHCGVNVDSIEKAILMDSGKISADPETLTDFLKNTASLYQKRILEAALKRYYRIELAKPIPSKGDPFLKTVKNRRKFPVPR